MYVPQYIFYVLSINISRSKGNERRPEADIYYYNLFIYTWRSIRATDGAPCIPTSVISLSLPELISIRRRRTRFGP